MECRYDVKGLANELGVDIAEIWGLFHAYVEEMKEEIRSMEEFSEKKDWFMLQRVVHNVKGVSANLKIFDVFSEAEKFDILLKAEETQDAYGHMKNLVDTINGAVEEINKFFTGLYK